MSEGETELDDKLKKRDTRRQTGQIGEEAACQSLLEGGYSVIERNWRCKTGEIDIIAELAGRIIFVEVRTRKEGGRFGSAAESVDYRKQQKVRENARVYLRSVGKSDALIRFDVIAIAINRLDNAIVAYRHYESAF